MLPISWLLISGVTRNNPSQRRIFLIRRGKHVIFAALQDGSFGAATQKLNEHRALRFAHVLGRSLFDDFSAIQHGHARRDVKRTVHEMCDDDRCRFSSFRQVDN